VLRQQVLKGPANPFRYLLDLPPRQAARGPQAVAALTLGQRIGKQLREGKGLGPRLDGPRRPGRLSEVLQVHRAVLRPAAHEEKLLGLRLGNDGVEFPQGCLQLRPRDPPRAAGLLRVRMEDPLQLLVGPPRPPSAPSLNLLPDLVRRVDCSMCKW
jgi:hypothetical protein